MRITIIGGGNLGTLMAAEFAQRNHRVSLLVADPSPWAETLEIYDADERLLASAEIATVTSDDTALENADLIFVTHPTFMLEETARRVLPFVHPGLLIGIVPGNDGEFFFREHISQGAVLFGLQRVHDIARIKEKGHSVYSLGRKPEIQIATIPARCADDVAQTMSELFAMPARPLPNYLVETLTPSNPILHTTRIRSMFQGWQPGMTYDRNILFYEEWDLPSAELLIACDEELQTLCRTLEEKTGLDLSLVKSLREHYESPDAPALVAKIASIPAFKGLTSPMKEVPNGGWIPDFSSRYFRADFAYGLQAIKGIAALADVRMPHIDEVLTWYENVSGKRPVSLPLPANIEELSNLYR